MRFTYLWPWWAVGLGFVIVSGVVAYTYLRLSRPLSQRLRLLFIVLRVMAALVLLICLLEPVLVERKDITPPSNLLLLVDASQSMQIEDVESGGERMSRLAFINKLLFHPSSRFLPDLAKRFNIHLYQFDARLHQISNAEGELDATGGLTDLTGAVQNAVNEWRGQPLAGAALLTDGAHNASTLTPESVAELKTPIYAVGVGNPNPPRDLKITKVDVSPVVYMEHDAPIRVTVQQTGYAGSKARLSLQQGDQVVAAVPMTLTDEHRQVVEFTLNPQAEGVFQYVVSLPVLEGELTGENNQKAFPLKVVKTRLRVLYIDGRPRWEYAFLKRALEKDPNVEPACLILSGKSVNQLRDTALARSNGYYPQTPDPARAPRFPRTLQEFLAYDVLIIGDIRPSLLSPEQQRAIVDFVEKHGKAVVFLGGKNSLGMDGFKNTPIAEVLPIVTQPAGCYVYDEDVSPKPTRQGLYHPMTRLGDADAKVESVWRDLPPLTRWLGGFRLKGGATVLAEHRQQRSEAAIPIIIFQRFGLGKSLLIAAEGLWNWAFGVWSFKAEDDAYARFWGQTVRWMATRADAKQINVTTDLTNYAVGDEAQIIVYVYDESYQPMENAEVAVEITPPDGKSFQLQPEASAQSPGAYRAQFRVNQKGAYQVRAVSANRLSSLGEDVTEIFVQAPLAEFENPEMNENLLKTLAEKTGGLYTPATQATSLPEKIREVQEGVYAIQERDIWDTPIILILVVTLLSVEWFLRKRAGLV